jgi:uncharacterized Rmd1/YagE family protein
MNKSSINKVVLLSKHNTCKNVPPISVIQRYNTCTQSIFKRILLWISPWPNIMWFALWHFFPKYTRTLGWSWSRRKCLELKRRLIVQKSFFFDPRKVERKLWLFHYGFVCFWNADGLKNAKILKDSIVKLTTFYGKSKPEFVRKWNDVTFHILRTCTSCAGSSVFDIH